MGELRQRALALGMQKVNYISEPTKEFLRIDYAPEHSGFYQKLSKINHSARDVLIVEICLDDDYGQVVYPNISDEYQPLTPQECLEFVENLNRNIELLTPKDY